MISAMRTGASSGFGEAIAIACAAEGIANVSLVARRVESCSRQLLQRARGRAGDGVEMKRFRNYLIGTTEIIMALVCPALIVSDDFYKTRPSS